MKNQCLNYLLRYTIFYKYFKITPRDQYNVKKKFKIKVKILFQSRLTYIL